MERMTEQILPRENESLLSSESTNLSSEAERGLILKAKEGNTEAFGQIYEIHCSRVYRHLFRMTGNHHTAEDLTADTFLKAFLAIPRFVDTGIPVSHWLIKIAQNQGTDYLRKGKTYYLTINEDTMSTDGDKTAVDVETKIMAERVNDLIASLPEDQAVALRMKFHENEGYSKIAYVLDKNENAVRVLTHRGLKKIRESLELEFLADDSEEEVA